MRKKSGPFEFVVRGFVDTDLRQYPGTDTNLMFFHFKYLSESLGRVSRTHLYTVEIDDPARAAEIAAAIDALFENSSDETFTETERRVHGQLHLHGRRPRRARERDRPRACASRSCWSRRTP